MSDLGDAIERLNPDASPNHLYRGPSSTADVEGDLRLLIAAARCSTTAERMPEDVQELVDEVDEFTDPDLGYTLGYHDEAQVMPLIRRLRDALEAAYSQMGAVDDPS